MLLEDSKGWEWSFTLQLNYLNCDTVKDDENEKPKPIREESFPSKLLFQKNDFKYVDKILNPNGRRSERLSSNLSIHGSPSDVFEELGECARPHRVPQFKSRLACHAQPEGRRKALCYEVPDRSTFSKFAKRLGPDKIVQIFSIIVVELIRKRIIKGGKRCHSTVQPYELGFTSARMRRVLNITTENVGSVSTET